MIKSAIGSIVNALVIGFGLTVVLGFPEQEGIRAVIIVFTITVQQISFWSLLILTKQE